MQVVGGVLGGVAPAERRGGAVVIFLERHDPPRQGRKVGEATGADGLALQNGKVDFHLVQPRPCMNIYLAAYGQFFMSAYSGAGYRPASAGTVRAAAEAVDH